MANITQKLCIEDIKNNRPSESHRNGMYDYWDNDIHMEYYPVQEVILDQKFQKYLLNVDEEIVRFKVRLVDMYYSTSLKEGFGDMVDNILNCKDFDVRVQAGDISLVNELKQVKSNRYGRKNCVSFVSKYCSRINPSAFPIYDKYVRELLYWINSVYDFYTPSFDSGALYDNYILYKDVIDAFIDVFFSGNMSYKDFDKYVWTWAKKLLNDQEVLERNESKNEK